MPASIGRRELIAAVGAAAAWPRASSAQQAAMPVIGFLRSTTAAGSAHLVSAFRHGLNESGHVENHNVAAIEYRWADDQRDRLAEMAADLVRRRVAVIVANTLAAQAAKAATTTTPIIFVSGTDPVSTGLVARGMTMRPKSVADE